MDDEMSDETIERAREKAGRRWPSAEEAFAEGLRIRGEMWGADGTAAQIEGATEFNWPCRTR